ncbi:RpiB/LacA/LacB family sugar-phosphate isomerase [Anaerolentibacter hominis]|uniref:RpiB/LacA/LacB family sugar-phosphate isomerase n=1 Tax=Anaerolentibacter hominis TaxID=3079009 RepID=UPI0031B8736F
MKLYIGSDAAGYPLKESIKKHLIELGMEFEDVGTQDPEKPMDYFAVSDLVANAIQEGKADRGILVCSSGMGMSIIANKHKGVYAAVVESEWAALKCRAINNANCMCMGTNLVAPFQANLMVDRFLNTEFTEGMGARSDYLVWAYAEVQKLDEKLCK